MKKSFVFAAILLSLYSQLSFSQSLTKPKSENEEISLVPPPPEVEDAVALPFNLKLECKYVGPIEDVFMVGHLRAPSNTDLQERISDQYLKHLDPLKIYFLESDIPMIRQHLAGIIDKTKKGDCSPLFKIQNLLKDRLQERIQFIKTVLGPKYKFDDKAQFEYDPTKRKFPANVKAAEEFLEKYVHFQISNYLSTDVKLKEAKASVIKQWERNLRRLKELKEQDVYAAYLDSYGGSFDPHTSFLSAESNEDFKISMALSLQGIGATLSSQDGFTVIEALVPGGAAARSGKLQPQDKIISVGQGEKGAMEPVFDMDLRDVVRKIRGKKGSKVRLQILRKEGEGKSRFDVVLVRDDIKLEDEAARLSVIEKDSGDGKKIKVGVIQLPSFYNAGRRGGRNATSDVRKAIEEAKSADVKGLVLDVSSNPGGSLDDAVKITGLFFKKGNVVKQSSKAEMGREILLDDRDPSVDWAGPLVVLTSRASASASEIVAGTLKDYKRAVVVGADHTFGKGSVQTVMEFPPNNGSLGAVKVTVGMFFTAGGFSTQHRGVDGDVVLPSVFSSDEVGEKTLDYSLPPTQIAPFLSPDAYVKEGPGAWKEVSADQIKTLVEKSKARVDKDPEFKKILDDIEKMKKQGKLIKVGETAKDSKEKKEKAKSYRTASREEKEKEYLKRAEVQESLNVLVDLVNIQKG